MSDPAPPRRTCNLTGPALLRATRAVLADQDPDPALHSVTPWFGAHAALRDLPPNTPEEVVLAAQTIAAHYAERECLRRAAVEGLPETIAHTLRLAAARMRRALASSLRALERRCGGALSGENRPPKQNLYGLTP